MSERLVASLLDYAGGERPVTIALMRLLSDSATEAEARGALRSARARRSADSLASGRLTALHDLWADHPGAFFTVRATLHGLADPADPLPRRFGIEDWARAFDRVVDVSPEASVAIYSLGSRDLLEASTREVQAWIDAQGLLGTDRDALELGCGIGRFLTALSPALRSIVGTDISAGMVAEARQRCAALANVSVRHVDGRSLADVASGSLDFVLAADVMPYLVEIGGGLVAQHLADTRRILRPGGCLLVLNYAYQGTYDEHLEALTAEAATAGLALKAAMARPFATWDAEAFVLTTA